MSHNRWKAQAPFHGIVESAPRELPPGFTACPLPPGLQPPPSQLLGLADIYRAAYEQARRASERELWRKLGFDSDWVI